LEQYQVSIIGSGLIGSAVGKVLACQGCKVIFHDIDESKLSLLSSQGYKICREIEEAILSTDFSFICVPTPNTERRFNPDSLREACSQVVKILDSKDNYHVVAIKSTVLPGVIESLGLNLGKRNYGFCLNPEFLRSETPEDDFRNSKFIIIGSFDERASLTLKAFYEDFRERVGGKFDIVITDPKTAAMIKYACNSLLATKISFFNEIYEVCKRLDVDLEIVMRHTLTDKIATSEWYRRKFLQFGFQDECLPKDLDAFITFCKGFNPGVEIELLRSVRRVNQRKSKQIDGNIPLR